MIIKSLSRSNKSFDSLFSYLTKDREFELYTHNLYANIYDKSAIIDEFMQNSYYIDKSMGKNYLYHEIISLKPNNLSQKFQKEILRDLTDKYISLRANNHLVLQAIHLDKDNLHIHLMISANEIASTKRKRVSKSNFANIQKSIEEYQNQKYPHLYSSHYQNQQLVKESLKEQQMKHRGSLTKKERLYSILKEKFSKSISKTSLINSLKNENIELYQRGNSVGVVYENKNYRLKTLKLDSEYKSLLREYELKNAREMKRSEYKGAKKSYSHQSSRTQQLKEDREQQAKQQSKSNEKEM